MGMGFTQQESRLGLRMCLGNVQLAVAHIMNRREVNLTYMNFSQTQTTQLNLSKLNLMGREKYFTLN